MTEPIAPPTESHEGSAAPVPPPEPAAAPASSPPSQAAGAGSGAGTGVKPKRGRPPGSGSKKRPTVSDKGLRDARHDAKRAENLVPARAALAEQRAAAPEKPALSDATLEAGARMFLRLLWLLSGLGARIFGGTLRPLNDDDTREGAKEAVPVIKRFRFLASLLSVLGFPLWMASTLSAKWERKPAAAPGAAPPPTTLRAVDGGQP